MSISGPKAYTYERTRTSAKAAGLRTAFVARPLEFGPEVEVNCEPDPTYDIFAKDFNAMADKLGA